MNKKQGGAAAVLVLLLLAAWMLGLFGGEDAEVAELRQQFENREQLSEQDRDAFRDRIRDLSDEQRRQLFEPMMQGRMAGMQTRLYELQAMPRAERNRELDQMIDESEQRRREWETRRSDSPPRGDRGQMTDAQRDERRKSRLDRTTPEMRSTMQQMTRMINERRAERGLKPFEGRGWRGR
ncbi:hypothetical protein Pla123a_48760 [Posidoniimonas polymericola]|uniref:Uncharacterized protein n=1 Tax=Posidoniimonas polymericola TaxID=2528002 RepID=A0A5C5XRX2_9BACT|nr:hypothetical protein [Posidoniimonas polymericola]TWT65408.1 hypothetical protein Pla123a_48760 [Posidoniimonas polymericola]